MTGSGKHLHILARNGRDMTDVKTISADTRQLTARDVRMGFDGTPYGDQPSIAAVLDHNFDVGYAIPPDANGWVCVLACAGADQDQCREKLTMAVVGGDIRLRKAIAKQESDRA